MYTLIRNGDGSLTFRTRRPADQMTVEEARRTLSGLLPLVQELASVAYPDGETPVEVAEEPGDGGGSAAGERLARPAMADLLRHGLPDGDGS